MFFIKCHSERMWYIKLQNINNKAKVKSITIGSNHFIIPNLEFGDTMALAYGTQNSINGFVTSTNTKINIYV